ncbi:hypothetical protein CA13_18140 [Planctomycetes bacterium CA13]|uniref:Carboxymuconolactone decarboxylase family protein n=2 Tax=Novipirellula herctigrandis TaxID=2527986 RepID=A0A5C5YZ71_9BACT|nr:hypothetical protein CA13_18140 [Planctomycetes bacterium CA13]
MVGLTADQVRRARLGGAEDTKVNAILEFTSHLIEKRGHVSDDDLAALRSVGVSDGEIAEIVANASLNLFTNYVNHVAQTEIDFPLAEQLSAGEKSDSCGCHDDKCSVA